MSLESSLLQSGQHHSLSLASQVVHISAAFHPSVSRSPSLQDSLKPVIQQPVLIPGGCPDPGAGSLEAGAGYASILSSLILETMILFSAP